MSESSPVVAIVQARMGSTRLPGKVLADIQGEPMLMRVVGRTAGSSLIDELWVATSDQPQDDPIAGLCEARSVKLYRGHATDVLDRYYQAARAAEAAVLVRITADCPLIDPQLIDDAVRIYLEAAPAVEFVANRLPDERSYPIGLDVEVCSFAALERAWRQATEPYQREHVMPYLYEGGKRQSIRLLQADRPLGHIRFTVDTQEDLEVVRAIYDHFGPRDDFGWQEVVDYLETHPEVAAVNADVQPKAYREAG